jgi:hypothetical protein
MSSPSKDLKNLRADESRSPCSGGVSINTLDPAVAKRVAAARAYRKAGLPSLRAAIDAFCRWCIYDPSPGEGTCAEQIRRCESRDCPLWPVRPGARHAR